MSENRKTKNRATLNDLVKVLPACRRLLFPLLHEEKGRLRNAVANRVPASRWVPKILGTSCDRLTQCALFDLTFIGCYRIWSDNVCGDLCNRGFPAKTNQNMCHCVQTVRNLVWGRGKFNVCEEIISLQFTVHETSHHIRKQCLRKLQKWRGLRTRKAFRRKPAKETKIFV